MSIQKVAKFAGVSTSTVSRVINNHPRVAPQTLQTVQRAIDELGFARSRRRNGQAESRKVSKRAGTIGFIVLGTDGSTPAPAFLRLLHGVTNAAEGNGLDLVFSFASDLAQAPRKILDSHLDGLLLHGELPGSDAQRELEKLPTVWLMANRRRPPWGDQVMPENTAVGELAACYLTNLGHRSLAYLGVGSANWFVGVRVLAFQHAAGESGAHTTVLMTADPADDGLWRDQSLPQAAEDLVRRFLALHPRPTALFVAEDRLLPAIYNALSNHGISIGSGRDVEIISCNNEQPHLLDVRPRPASIDIRPDVIGRCGVERLLWRIQNPASHERIRMMIEPALVQPPEIDQNSSIVSQTNHLVSVSLKSEEMV